MNKRKRASLGAVCGLALLLAGCTSTQSATAATASSAVARVAAHTSAEARLRTAIRRLERQDNERIGVAVHVIGTNEHLSYRGSERFALDSTGKAFIATLLLRQDSDAQLGQIVHYTAADLVDYSPITEQHVASGMPLRDLIAAALQYSDNTAANLLLEQLGGPAAAELKVRALGDSITNLDRNEPTLNTAIPGDPRDTSTPNQVAQDLQRFTLGSVLSPTRRALLVELMRGNTTGTADIRAAVPATWTVADKTGSGGYATNNDIALVTRPDGAPVIITIYTSGKASTATTPDGIVGMVAKAAVASLR